MVSTKNKGFTLVELMISMAFIGILLIVMTLSIIHVSTMYSKGLTIKAINQAGRDLGDALKRDGANLAGLTVSPIVQPTEQGTGGLGRLCLGSYSYLWNQASALQPGGAPINYRDTTTPIVLARVSDPNAGYCKKQTNDNYNTVVDRNNAVEMLPADKGDFALHALSLDRTPPLGSPLAGSSLYDIKYTVGTNQTDTLDGAINTLDRSCKPPSDTTNNFNFCSINEFEIILRVD